MDLIGIEPTTLRMRTVRSSMSIVNTPHKKEEFWEKWTFYRGINRAPAVGAEKPLFSDNWNRVSEKKRDLDTTRMCVHVSRKSEIDARMRSIWIISQKAKWNESKMFFENELEAQ